ncbi:MAG: twitching motility protein PilT [Lachnospiraceae bacterium]|nr:twitching motility protein PilT [Lachnospiraceae bacterium]
MIKLVLGSKGKGKTKYMIDTANAEAKESDGLVIYIDKNSEHMFQLDRQIRLINVKEYPVNDLDSLMGFLCGLIAGNGDIVSIYLDSFLILCEIEKEEAVEPLRKMLVLSEKLGVEFTISASMEEDLLPEDFKQHIHIAL